VTVLASASGHAEVAGYLKGQLHAHTSNSADARTPPAEVAQYYQDRGYDFVVLTDHNRVTELAWKGPLLVIPGAELTQSVELCYPRPTGRRKCIVHMNALFATGPAGKVRWPVLKSRQRIDLYDREIQLARSLGALAMINHPNSHRTCDAALAREIAQRGVVLIEIFNQGLRRTNPGNRRRPSTAKLWDTVLTSGVDMWAVASDDAHHYLDVDLVRRRRWPVYPANRGWVMVRARKDPASIRDALARGDFYSSTGVTLLRYAVTPDALELATSEVVLFTFIGAGGKVLRVAMGLGARFSLEEARGGYVRVAMRGANGHRAWTQPVRVP